MRLRRPIQTRFRYGFPSRVNLATYHNSQAHSSKGTRSLHFSPKADTLPRLVGTRFQVLFHDPSPGYFSPFPHGTCSLSVTREYLGLEGGPPMFRQDFTCPALLKDCLLYTSDAADDLLCVDLGGRRIIKKKKKTKSIACM